ncbi:MAG TPA: sugar phosphate isomerase/epimerase family protein [Methylomirabilota bacterium]|nr:sugar phosphate isomerase/epimerase family protein [Methylomirabilota bacterium]
MIHQDISRREFLTRAAVAGAVTALAPATFSAQVIEKRYKIIVFTKPFRTLNAKQTAELVAEVGWDGVELPVRGKDGQLTPDNVNDALPEFVEAMRSRGREVSIVTTDITSLTPAAAKVLRAVSKVGIKRYRLGFFPYAKSQPIPEQLNEISARLRDLVALNKELGLQAGFQNHSGDARVGAAVWDIWTIIKDFDPQSIGYCFDIGHATIEGGLAWPTNFRLAEPRLSAVFVKDFQWQKTANGGKSAWCPLGEGMVSKKFFTILKATKFEGPICQHHEYELGDREKAMAHYKRDLAVLREWLS